jgi:hypothetical protein
MPDSLPDPVVPAYGLGCEMAPFTLYSALIEEIKIHSDDTLQPVFRVPLARAAEEPTLDGPAPDDDLVDPAVRILTTKWAILGSNQ